MPELTILLDQKRMRADVLATKLKTINGVSLRFVDGPIIDLNVTDSAVEAVRAIVGKAGGSIYGVAQPVLMEPVDPWQAVGHSIG